uniref:Uncharacterized protein n=1 Tax=Arundo donax TaxID=35708 RepID=A0A0A9HTB3_ARUDO
MVYSCCSNIFFLSVGVANCSDYFVCSFWDVLQVVPFLSLKYVLL